METIFAPLLGPVLAQLLSIALGNGFFAVGVPALVEIALRTRRFPWLDHNSARVLKVAAGVAAALAAAGIKSELDINAGTFAVVGLTQVGLGRFAAEVVTQLGLQEAAYRLLIKGQLVRQPEDRQR